MVGPVPGGVLDAAGYFLELALWVGPLFVLASFLVGIVEEYLSPERLQELMEGQRGGRGTVSATALGAVTPFCSCASIPVVAALLKARAPLGISLSFLIASPLINEVAILLLGGLFGWDVAALYVALTFVTVVVLGLVVDRFELHHHIKVDRAPQPVADGGTATDCAPGPARTPTHREHLRSGARRALTFFFDMAPYLILGMALAAVLHEFVPVQWIQGLLGSENPVAVPTATFLGAPIYVSISAMLPLASSLVDQGISLGTVLAFVIGGAGVSIPNLVILTKFFDRYLLALYVAIVASVGITVGVVLNALPF